MILHCRILSIAPMLWPVSFHFTRSHFEATGTIVGRGRILQRTNQFCINLYCLEQLLHRAAAPKVPCSHDDVWQEKNNVRKKKVELIFFIPPPIIKCVFAVFLDIIRL